MKQTTWQDRSIVVLFSVTLAIFFLFFFYMFTNERVSVFHLEQTHDYTTLTGVQCTTREDPTAPAGVVKVYQGILDPESYQRRAAFASISPTIISMFILTTRSSIG